MSQRWMSLAERPDLFDAATAIDSDTSAATFTQHDEVGMLARADRLRDRWPDYFLVLIDEDARVLARAAMVPLFLDRPGREKLPTNGWDGAVL